MFFWRAARVTCLTGFMAGTIYFLVIAAVSFFDGVLGSSVPSLLSLALFVGGGALVGLSLGVVCAATLSLVLWRRPRTSAHSSVTRLRVVGGVACGLPVLAFTVWEQLTGTIGLLDPDVTTVVLIPTVVAVVGGVSAAPHLVRRDDGKA